MVASEEQKLVFVSVPMPDKGIKSQMAALIVE